MRKTLIAVLVGLFMVSFTATASAVSVLAPAPVTAPTGTILAQILNQSFTGRDVANAAIYSGTYSHWVVDTGNGYAFLYQFHNNNTGPTQAIKRWTSSDFKGFNYTFGYDMSPTITGSLLPAGDTEPFQIDGGVTVGWSYTDIVYNSTDFYSIHPGDNSPLMWVLTDATHYAAGTSSVIDGATTNVFTYSPAIPEPGTMLLLGMGIFGLFGLRKRKIA